MQTDVDAVDELPPTVEALAEWLAAAPAPEVEAQASWWLRSLGLLRHELDGIDAREAAEVARVRAHYAKQRDPLVARANALERSLEALAERISYAKGRKSLALTYGTIGRRHVPTAVRITDDAAAVAWAKAHGIPDAVKVTEKPVHKALVPLILSLPTAPDGFEIVPAADVPYASTNSAAGVL